MIAHRTLPVGWTVTRLADVCREITVGHVGSMADKYQVAGIPFLRSQNILPFKLSLEDVKYIPEDFHAKLKKSALSPGDVAIVRTGYPGTACVIPSSLKDSNCADLVIVRPNEALHPWFLVAVLNSSWGRSSIAGNLVGAAQQHFNVGAAKAMQIALPPLSQQYRIASILSAYDNLIENNTRRIAILWEMARRIYEEWFVRFRFPGHDGVQMEESVLGLVPKGWRVRSVADVARVHRGRSYKSSELADTGGLPFVNLKCMERDGGFRASGLKRYTGVYKDTQTVRAGALVMAVTDMTQERRIVARVGLVSQLDQAFGVISMDLVRIETLGELPEPYLYGMFRWSGFADEVKHHANGANVLHLHPARIESYRFACPPSELAEHFVEVVAPMFSLCDELERQSANLRVTRDLLLPKLISGELNVSELSLPEAIAA